MEEWKRTTLSLCIFGLTRGFRPSESYKVPFLLGPWRDLTKDTLNNVVYPTALYAYTVLLVVVFLLTDLLRYKPIIIMSGVCSSIVYALLLWTKSLLWLQVSQVLFGLYMATDVAYLTYMFAKVDPDKYARVSSYTRASSLVGRFVSGLIGQVLTTYNVLDYKQLNYITFSMQCLSIVWALLLPSVGFSLYFHRKNNLEKVNKNCADIQEERQTFGEMCSGASDLVLKHAKMAYTNREVVTWSLWFAGLSCCFLQMNSYVQFLWTSIDPDEKNVYNGAVEASLTLFGTFGALAASRCGSHAVASMLAAPLAAVISAAIIASSLTANIFVSYTCYVFAGALYHFCITLVSTQIAKGLGDESCFGLVFGINMFAATTLQSLLTFVTITILKLDITRQYVVYGSLIALMAAVWQVGWLYGLAKKHTKKSELKDKEEQNNNHLDA